MPERPRAGDAERLAGLRAVSHPGVESEKPEPSRALVAHVGAGQIAEARVERFAHPRRKQLVKAVEVSHENRFARLVRERAPADEAVSPADLERPPEPQAVVRLFEHERRAHGVFVEVAPRAVSRFAAPRLPARGSRRALHVEDAQGSGGLGAREDFIRSLVGKDGVVGIRAPRGEGPVAPRKKPEIRVAHNAHQKRRHRVHIADDKIGLPVDQGFLHRRLSVRGKNIFRRMRNFPVPARAGSDR